MASNPTLSAYEQVVAGASEASTLAKIADPRLHYPAIKKGSTAEKLQRHTGWFVESVRMIEHLQTYNYIVFATIAEALGYPRAAIFSAVVTHPDHKYMAHLARHYQKLPADIFEGRAPPAFLLDQLHNHLRLIGGADVQEVKAEMAIRQRQKAGK
jgi:hypothetical protein